MEQPDEEQITVEETEQVKEQIPFNFTPKKPRRVKQKKWQKGENEDKQEQPRVLGHAVLTKPAYDDCRLLGPNGELMAKINIKRFNWYLKKGIATQVDEHSIQLNFEPKGLGNANDPFYLGPMVNRCVCCGDDSNYTKHHIVPYEYRKCFPKEFKSRANHDVVLLCAKCHEDYETEAMRYKKEQIVDKYQIPVHGTGITRDVNVVRATRNANALKNFSDRLPETRFKELVLQVNEFLGKTENLDVTPTDEELDEIMRRNDLVGVEEFESHGEQVVSKLIQEPLANDDFEQVEENLNEFCISWREHFLETMKPKFMSEHWDPRRKLDRR